jgi:serine/threonine protein kinase
VNDRSSKKATLTDFTILDALGSGSFGTVYAVYRNGEAKVKGKPKIYAMKFLEKSNVL